MCTSSLDGYVLISCSPTSHSQMAVLDVMAAVRLVN